MRYRHSFARTGFAIGIVAAFLLAGPARAQTGPDLLLQPWPTGQKIQTTGDLTLVNSGSTRASDDFRLTFYDTSGRVRLFPEQRADPRFGWNYTQINTSGDPTLPSQLVDTSVGIGMGVADVNGWLAGITLGVGYAGAGAFDDGNGWYGMADFLIGREFDKNTSLGFVVDYNGNRTFLPDVPLIGFLYQKRLMPQLLLGLGFPYSSVEYKPNDRLTLSGRFSVPDSLKVRADYEFLKNVGLFAEYNYLQAAFHWDALASGSDRLLYDSKRAEIGLRWEPRENVNVIVAGGYVFGQEFNAGWDSREPDRVAKPSDEPYARVGFEIRY